MGKSIWYSHVFARLLTKSLIPQYPMSSGRVFSSVVYLIAQRCWRRSLQLRRTAFAWYVERAWYRNAFLHGGAIDSLYREVEYSRVQLAVGASRATTVMKYDWNVEERDDLMRGVIPPSIQHLMPCPAWLEFCVGYVVLVTDVVEPKAFDRQTMLATALYRCVLYTFYTLFSTYQDLLSFIRQTIKAFAFWCHGTELAILCMLEVQDPPNHPTQGRP